MMPKLVCTKCQLQFMMHQIGVYVVDTFGNPPQPYKVWVSDVHHCRGCDTKVVAGFNKQPLWEHFQEGFWDWWEKIKANPEATIIYCYEYIRQSTAPRTHQTDDEKS
jgi:hypothetical protein